MTRNILAVAAILLVAACTPPKMTVSADEQVPIAFYTVTPQVEWNRGMAWNETWTVDGFGLQAIRFYAVPDGQSLEPERSAFGKPLPPGDKTPVFRKTMIPNEIQEFIVETLATGGWASVKASKLSPAKFGSLPGFKFSFTMKSENGLEFKGRALGTVKDDELHIILYSGTSLHYYPKHEKDVERLFASIKT